MPFENLLLTLRRKFSERLPKLFGCRTNRADVIQMPILQPCVQEPEYVQEIRHLIENHLDEVDFNVSVLCHKCKASQSKMYRKLTSLTGLSPVRFIRSVRLLRAKELLRQTNLTIAEVAYETGFSSPAYFTRLFVKTFRVTPSKYRESDYEPAYE